MNLDEIKQKLLNYDDFILSETKKIQYAYELKHVIRYIVDRKEEVASESVAEHIYALHLLADYFLPLEDEEQKWDWYKVHTMIQYHDLDEVETGDTIGYLKTDEQKASEASAREIAFSKLPEHMQPGLQRTSREYEERVSIEARFAKALDAIEPQFQLYNENGKKIFQLQKATRENNRMLKEPYVKPFPFLERFYKVLEETMEKEGFFYPD